MEMHFFDITVGIFLLIFVGIGIKRGFITEIFRVVAVVFGFVAAILFYKDAFAALQFLSIPNTGKTALSFLLVYALAAFAVLMTGWTVKKIIHFSMLGWVDRLLGGLLGFTKVMVVTWVLILTVLLAPGSSVELQIRESITYSLLRSIPFRLQVPGIPKKIPGAESIPEDPVSKLKEAKDKLDGFRSKVDSLKNQQDSIKKAYKQFRDAI